MRPAIGAGRVPGITTEMMDSAIYTPRNEGAWFFMALGDHTLFGYHATTVVGGDIPEGLFSQVVYSGLDSLLKDLATRAEETVPAHYVKGHELLPGGDGRNIPLPQPAQ